MGILARQLAVNREVFGYMLAIASANKGYSGRAAEYRFLFERPQPSVNERCLYWEWILDIRI